MIERRHGTGGGAVEVRAGAREVLITGYPAVFDKEAVIAGSFRERIAPGAFLSAIERDDIPLLLQHSGTAIARNRSGTMRLSEDATGLRMAASLDPRNPDVQRVVSALERGDVDQMSFAFRASVQDWFDDDDQNLPLRVIREAALYDVSLVNLAAYTETSVALARD